MYDTLAAVISDSGIWNGARRESHAFLLSPSVYRISEAQHQELSTLGFALHDCMMGLSHIAVIAYDRDLNYGGAWSLARKVFSTGVPQIYQQLQGMNVRHIPKLLKVDLMVDRNGEFRIAEVDGHNKHGVGYSTLALRLRDAVHPNSKALPGTVRALSDEIRRLGHQEVTLLYADQERFYIPEFEIAGQEFRKYGVECRIVSEMDADESSLQQGLFLDLPFLYHRPALYDTLVGAYLRGDAGFIIPPKPFLGAKGVLALLRNDAGDERVEALLKAFISSRSLERVRRHLPETLFVGRHAEGFDSVKRRISQKRYVLKESISSGMKGTVFSDDPDFDRTLAVASRSHMNWILQEEVANQPQTFSWFENGHHGPPELRTADTWLMRVTVQYVNRHLADVIVTARRDKSVHGAKDCLQLGTIIA